MKKKSTPFYRMIEQKFEMLEIGVIRRLVAKLHDKDAKDLYYDLTGIAKRYFKSNTVDEDSEWFPDYLHAVHLYFKNLNADLTDDYRHELADKVAGIYLTEEELIALYPVVETGLEGSWEKV